MMTGEYFGIEDPRELDGEPDTDAIHRSDLMQRITELYCMLSRRYGTRGINGWACENAHLFEIVRNCAVYGATRRRDAK